MRWYEHTINGSCGVGVVYHFTPDDRFGSKNAPFGQLHAGGAGWTLASFVVGNEVCDAAYKELKETFPIVYQSPVRTNVNSGNEFYFCIFDRGEQEPIREDEEDYDF